MFIDQGYPVRKVLEAVELSASCYYYVPKGGKRGKKPSTHTKSIDGRIVSNAVVVQDIEQLLQREFVDYGYVKVTYYLRDQMNYLINEKKVYRLMNEHKLLYTRRVIKRTGRQWVQELVPKPDQIFEHLEVDIKYLYVYGKRRNAMQITVLDVKSRYVLDYTLGWSITKMDVINLFKCIFAMYQFPKSVYVRCDNGSQFVATLVRNYFAGIPGVVQEFTRPVTPEQNAHIEAFHSIVESVICRAYCFEDFEELDETMKRFITFYNNERIHSGVGYKSPIHYIRSKMQNFNGGRDTDCSTDKSLLNAQSEGLACGQDVVGGSEKSKFEK